MPIEHLKSSDTPERIGEFLRRDGCCVVDRLVDKSVLDQVRAELAPWFESVKDGRDDFSGHCTQRIGGLIPRSPTSHGLI